VQIGSKIVVKMASGTVKRSVVCAADSTNQQIFKMNSSVFSAVTKN
jgi:hypothetical protein